MATTAVPAAAPAEEAAPAPAKGKKKLILIGAAALLALVLIGGGVTVWLLKGKSDDTTAEATEESAEPLAAEEAEAKPKKKHDKKHAPVFLPLEMFTVNLADRESERYAQVGITLELSDAKVGEQLKAYMPAVRNDILMLLAHKKASELQERSGKVTLAREIRQAALKPFSEDQDDKPSDPDEDAAVRAVHFSNFIIQ